jgi:large subunit ribosomal protein L1
MAQRGRRYREALGAFDRNRLYPPREAIALVKSFPPSRFDETVELDLRLGVDPRKADQMVRGAVSLPKGTGKTVRVAVFAKGDQARAAEESGADVVGAEDLVERVQGGWLGFDAAVAAPATMPLVGRLGRILGPRGLMPNPKSGTVTEDVGRAVRDLKGGLVEYRTDRHGNLHLVIGKRSFTEDDLVVNYATVIDEVLRAKPAAAKGRYLRGITLSTTMGPGIRIDPNKAKDVETGDVTAGVA